MANSFGSKVAPLAARFLWVNLTAETHTPLGASAAGKHDVHSVHEPTQISAAIRAHAPLFLCFEFDQLDALGMATLAQIRCAYPSLPVLMITGDHSEAVALWALRIRVWDLLVKPVSNVELSQRIHSLIEMTRQRSLGPSRDIRFPSQVNEAIPVLNGPRAQGKTHPAITHVTTHFKSEITLADVAALCRLSPSRFSHVFRQEHGVSFGQHLLRYRLERACEQLADPDALAKEVAYAVGFNDLSYFARAFKRQLGVCPSKYQATARLS
jgi:two-component system, response regulator YesN